MPQNLSDILWGPYTALVIFLVGLYLGVKTRFFYLRHPVIIFKETFGKLFKKADDSGGISPFKAMSVALGGTMGTGNITGVATAIAMGGPGAVVWMWLSALVGMVLKYAETALAMDTRIKTESGYEGSPMRYLRLLPGAKVTCAMFAVALLCCTLFGGNIVQTNAAAAMGLRMGVPAVATGAVFCLIVVILSFGGIRRVADTLSLLVPFMTIAYLAAAGWAIFQGREALWGLLCDMVGSALGIRQLGGGLAGYTVSQAMRFGMARGLFTNEAGFGTAPIAHAASSETRPAVQAMWGIVEVFIDTIVCCTATAVVVLLAPQGLDPALSGAQITADAFGALIGPFFETMVAIFTIVFALVSILGWYVYGESAVKSLFGPGRRTVNTYRLVCGIACVVGAVMMPAMAWQLTDISSWLMLAINLPAVVRLSHRVNRVTAKYVKSIGRGR